MSQEEKGKAILDMLRVIDKGVVMEQNARTFYLSAADKVKSDEGRKMMKWLADFEQGHASRLLERKKALMGRLRSLELDPLNFDNFDVSETSESKRLAPDASEMDILKMAIENEKRAYAFFTKKVTFAGDKSIETFFREMAAQEEQHIKILNDQLDHLKATQRWKDFSEFDEYLEKHKKD
jgi:rubrerythrin